VSTASNSGISLKMLVSGVFQVEILLDNWLLAERKRNLIEEEKPSPFEN
jgi:hypothetical protein